MVLNSRNKVYQTVNTEMLNLYWNIGKTIIEIQQGDERASYGDYVLEKLSQKLTKELGKEFKKFKNHEEILYSLSNLEDSVYQIELVSLFRIN